MTDFAHERGAGIRTLTGVRGYTVIWICVFHYTLLWPLARWLMTTVASAKATISAELAA